MSNSIYEIRQCRAQELDKVMHFIDNHWKKGHILATCRELMDFSHKNKEELYNYIIALNKNSGEIDGLIGFISTSHYDIALSEEKDLWGAIWKVREDIVNDEIKMLGLLLFEKLAEITNLKTFGAIGISKIAKKLYKALRYQTGSLNQYFIINTSLEKLSIAQANTYKNNASASLSGNATLKYISDLTQIENITCLYSPKKSITYFINRYAKHPFYKYRFLGIYNENTLLTILVVRTISINDAKAMRIVDLIGEYNTLPNVYHEFQSILTEECTEYVDFVNYGMKEETLSQMGFHKLVPDGDLIIPNYFEPFERKNIELEFAFKSTRPYMIFKGDSDQDRPNIL